MFECTKPESILVSDKTYSFENTSDRFRESLRRFSHQIGSTTRPEPVGVNGKIMTDSDGGRFISHARPWLNYDSLPTGEVIVVDDAYMVIFTRVASSCYKMFLNPPFCLSHKIIKRKCWLVVKVPILAYPGIIRSMPRLPFPSRQSNCLLRWRQDKIDSSRSGEFAKHNKMHIYIYINPDLYPSHICNLQKSIVI